MNQIKHYILHHFLHLRNKWIKIKTYKDKKGKYGRWLADVFIEENDTQLNVNDWLISEGHAMPLE